MLHPGQPNLSPLYQPSLLSLRFSIAKPAGVQFRLPASIPARSKPSSQSRFLELRCVRSVPTMTVSEDEDEDESLAYYLESEVLSEVSDQEETKAVVAVETEEEREPKRLRVETEFFSKIPPELFHHILKFLSSEDLISCSQVCRLLNFVASDECLWRRLYCMRWGLLPPTTKLRECAWKKLYIQRDEEDMAEFVRNCTSEFKEYYVQMQAAKRSQTPLPSQVNDDRIILDKTLSDQVSIWKSSRGLTDKVVLDHDCSGETCTYYQIGDVFVCEKTGQVHVCDDTCREAVLDPTNEHLVCTISGHCFDRLLSPGEMEPDTEQEQGGVSDEAEPFMGSGRFARAYLLGYNCADEKELQAALKFC
ncbi:F-box protein SKIP31 [Camellia lanceoleosa]|uniref:F-box protein SKIP31 n=1 Tax=Camellia lanceoleosa TaxID=1840588 RepID=A0ACC0G0F6_9ERIC|nr:F-box protein SKIP31 [Camellia lanceoleosa]